MAKREYSIDDIEIIDAVTAVRRRPEMYVGPLEDPAAINTLLTESICIALDNATSGCATEIAITLHDDGSASVRDNGPGLNIDVVHDGMTAIEILLTQLHACRAAKRNRINESICGVGIVVTNALSDSLKIETVQEGFLWQQTYSRGKAVGPIEKVQPCPEQWQQIAFHPDPEIFGDRQLSPTYFTQWFKRQHIELGVAAITLSHKGGSVQLHAASQQSR